MKNGEEAEEPTRRRVVATILRHGPSTALYLADALNLTTAAIRRHLTALTESGHLVERDAPSEVDRGRGRPAKIYMLSDHGRATFFHSYDDLAIQALNFLRESGGDEAVRAFAEGRAAQIERIAHELAAQHPEMTPVEVLTAALEGQGHVPTNESVGPGKQLLQHHCPVSHVAELYPELCEAETRAFERFLGSNVTRLATIAHGNHVCTTSIPTRLPAPALLQDRGVDKGEK